MIRMVLTRSDHSRLGTPLTSPLSNPNKPLQSTPGSGSQGCPGRCPRAKTHPGAIPAHLCLLSAPAGRPARRHSTASLPGPRPRGRPRRRGSATTAWSTASCSSTPTPGSDRSPISRPLPMASCASSQPPRSPAMRTDAEDGLGLALGLELRLGYAPAARWPADEDPHGCHRSDPSDYLTPQSTPNQSATFRSALPPASLDPSQSLPSLSPSQLTPLNLHPSPRPCRHPSPSALAHSSFIPRCDSFDPTSPGQMMPITLPTPSSQSESIIDPPPLEVDPSIEPSLEPPQNALNPPEPHPPIPSARGSPISSDHRAPSPRPTIHTLPRQPVHHRLDPSPFSPGRPTLDRLTTEPTQARISEPIDSVPTSSLEHEPPKLVQAILERDPSRDSCPSSSAPTHSTLQGHLYHDDSDDRPEESSSEPSSTGNPEILQPSLHPPSTEFLGTHRTDPSQTGLGPEEDQSSRSPPSDPKLQPETNGRSSRVNCAGTPSSSLQSGADPLPDSSSDSGPGSDSDSDSDSDGEGSSSSSTSETDQIITDEDVDELKQLLRMAKAKARMTAKEQDEVGSDDASSITIGKGTMMRFDDEDELDLKKSSRLSRPLQRSVLVKQHVLNHQGFKNEPPSESNSLRPHSSHDGLAPTPNFDRVSIIKERQLGIQPVKKHQVLDWADLPVQEITKEVKMEIQGMRLHQTLDPKKFFKGGIERSIKEPIPSKFLFGHIIDPSSTSILNPSTSSSIKKRSFVDSLLEDQKGQEWSKKQYLDQVQAPNHHRNRFKNKKVHLQKHKKK